jgi:hypothetical protein
MLRPNGGTWHIAFNGTDVHVPDLKGLWHLRELVARPHRPVPPLSLVGALSDEPIPSTDTGAMLDRQALRQYRQRLGELDDVTKSIDEPARWATLPPNSFVP